MNDIILIGGGGHCKSVIDVIELENRFNIAGIIDKAEFVGTSILGYKVIGDDSKMKELASTFTNAIITIGQIESPDKRKILFNNALAAGFKLPSIVSPKAYLSKYSKVGSGTIVMHHALVNANVQIGSNCIINSGSIIEHDSKILDHCHISTNTCINGGVSIGEGSFLGSGSTTKESLVIPKNSFVKAGSLVK